MHPGKIFPNCPQNCQQFFRGQRHGIAIRQKYFSHIRIDQGNIFDLSNDFRFLFNAELFARVHFAKRTFIPGTAEGDLEN